MDLSTENRIAAILMKEAAELRRQVDREGSLAYLQKPQARGRPNSRFLTATVLSVQQANRSVEVKEMWRVRHKELELDERINRRSRDDGSNCRSHTDSYRSRSNRHSPTGEYNSSSCSPTNIACDEIQSMETGGLKEDEIEAFLQSRTKCGRGAVGSRMDETGPYFAQDFQEKQSTSPNVRSERESKCRVLGPEKPFTLNHDESSEESDEDRLRKSKKGRSRSRSSHKEESNKHESKKSKKKKRDEEKRRKYRK